MCDIVGYASQFTRVGLDVSFARISHRGPDDSSVYEKHERDLAFSCLAILDLSSLCHQPTHSENHAVVLEFSGDLVYVRGVAKYFLIALEKIQ